MTKEERELLERVAELGSALGESLRQAADAFETLAATMNVQAPLAEEALAQIEAAEEPLDLPEKHCEECGERLVLRPRRKGRRGESPEQFARRRFCNSQCAGRARRTVKDAPDTKSCQHCGEEFSRGVTEGAATFVGRKFCSRACFFAAGGPARGKRSEPRPAPRPKPARKPKPPAPAVEAPARLCPACGKPLTRRKGEKPVRFRERKFCNQECFQKEWAKPKAAPAARGSGPQRNSSGFRLPDPTPPPVEEIGVRRDYGRIEVLGEPCPTHPSERVGFYGCPACNAARRWADQQREVSMRPSREGGR